jgi:hypothetical protein
LKEKYKIIRFTITKDENQNNLKILFLIELSIESDGNVYADSENSSNSSPLIRDLCITQPKNHQSDKITPI